MTALLTWLAFVLAAAVIIYANPTRRQAVALAIVAALTLPATAATLGRAAPWQPSGIEFRVLGARIDVDKAIWVLLDEGGNDPVYHRLPYSVKMANELQDALDAAAGNGSSVVMRPGQDGSPGFAEGGGEQEQPKQAETPIIGE